VALRAARTGNYRKLSRALPELARSGLDLRRCSVADLEALYGVGPKTARYFILHTRPDARVAALDTHVLKYLSTLGHEVPKSTPSSGRRYAELEKAFLAEADSLGLSPAHLDLLVWTSYSKSALPSYHEGEAKKFGVCTGRIPKQLVVERLMKGVKAHDNTSHRQDHQSQ
jgi:hypothetical protein